MLERQWTLNQSQIIVQEFQRDTEYKPSRQQLFKKTHLHQIKKIEDYLKIHQPILSDKKRAIIQETLQLDKIAEKKAKQRTKKNKYFVQYDYNPLNGKKNKNFNHSFNKTQPVATRSQSKLKLEPKEKKERWNETSLLEAVNNIKENDFRRSNEQIMNATTSSHLLFAKTMSNTLKLGYNLSRSQQKLKQQDIEKEQISFEQILTLPDRNYYKEKQGPVNIFEVMLGNHRSVLTNTILLKYHFSFTSILQKLQKHKVGIYREISRLARSLVCSANIPKNVRFDLLNSREMSFSLKDIRFVDLISLSSGRIDSQWAYSILYEGNAQKDISPNSSLVDQDGIHYEDGKAHKKTLCNNQQDHQQEKSDYLRLENSEFQAKCGKKYQKMTETVRNNLKEQEGVVKKTIKDKKLHQNYSKLVRKDTECLADMDNECNIETDRIIRDNKKMKNRQERLKIRELLNTINIANQYHDRLAPILTTTSRKKI